MVAYDDLMELGGMSGARTHGKLRKEGKLTAKGERVNMRYALVGQDEIKAVPPVKRKK